MHGVDQAQMCKADVDSVNVHYRRGQPVQNIWLIISRRGLEWMNGKVIGV
jgi:hypothetical protein